jgi:hypothetical protein
LVPLAKSWLSAPKMTVAPGAFQAEGFDPAQKAFVAARSGPAGPAALDVTLRAGVDSPVVNPALYIRNWGGAEPRIEINGRIAAHSKDVRIGRVSRLEGEDLVIWLRLESTAPVRIVVRPGESSK